MAAYDWGKGLIKGLIWGGLIGLMIGIVYAKKRDKGTWEKIGKSADEWVDKTKEYLGRSRRKMEEPADRGQDSSAGEKEGLTKAEAPQV
jgi:gas vesicle protein